MSEVVNGRNVLWRDHGHGIATLTFDRPPVNALDALAYGVAADALERFAASADARALVLTGAGTRAFCAGTDRAAFHQPAAAPRVEGNAHRFFSVLAAAPFVLIAAVNGPAVGGGAMIAAECDVIVAAANSYFSIPELQLGVPGAGSHVKRLAPYKKVQRMMLLGERLTAQEAVAFGSVAEVLPAAEVLPRALECAAAVSALDARAVREARAIFKRPEAEDALRGYRQELEAMDRVVGAPPRACGS